MSGPAPGDPVEGQDPPGERRSPALAPATIPAWAVMFRNRDQPGASLPRELPDPPPARTVSGTYFRHSDPKYGALELQQPAPTSGRYHLKGDEAPAYCASSVEASWAELFRHVEPAISPFEVKRRMSRLEIDGLRVLDLTNPDIRDALDVPERRLVGNALRTCQQLARFVRRWPDHFDGILAPSAGVRGMETLVIFPRGFPHARVVDEDTGPPPTRLIYLFEQVVGSLPPRLQDGLYHWARQIRQEIGRRTGR
jgi:RES domain-containing protein